MAYLVEYGLHSVVLVAASLDPQTCDELVRLYPYERRAEASERLGYSRITLNAICRGERRPKPEVAQIISAESRGRLSVARLCGWDPPTRHPGCRIFDDDPMPLARADGREVFRDRASDHDAVLYLRELALECPREVREALEVVLDHLGPPTTESAP